MTYINISCLLYCINSILTFEKIPACNLLDVEKNSANSYDLAESAMLASCCYTHSALNLRKKCKKVSNSKVIIRNTKISEGFDQKKLNYKKDFLDFFFLHFQITVYC